MTIGFHEIDAGRALGDDYIVELADGAHLEPGALDEVAAVLARFPSQLLYGDSREGGAVLRRPVFSPLRLREQDYLGPLRVYSRTVFGTDPSLLTDVVHVPRVLSSAPHRVAVPRGDEVQSHWPEAEVTRRGDGSRRVRYPVQGEPLVSIIIPTRGSSAVIRGTERVLVVDAVRAIVERSTYRSFEIVIVADDETPQSVIDDLITVGAGSVRLVRWTDSFNFSAKVNRGAAFASGEYLLLLNDDTDPISEDWIGTMLGLAQQPGVGMVGSLLLFEDGTVQHGGHLYRDSWAGHIAWGWPMDRDDALGSMRVTREVSGVTAACALISAELFWSIGGLSSVFAGNYNDVDLSLKVRAAGRSIVWTPDARLYHFESKTREAAVAPSELAALRQRWGTRLLIDPYWSE
ncbi:glycosyltransferase family 2 protein [Lacisediminihabitans changchengi]|uniref:Glycosyltransferase n=1 Tax=Lacisediminihabitans changchengi TaxID=2787634 RepID=A0A934SNY8_9MICO|nr:glycosyltransferase [Lacisediminihabitans changchengi]MBK4346418.1 glycosyltransferase [Lacisediminihabitans changchengi]